MHYHYLSVDILEGQREFDTRKPTILPGIHRLKKTPADELINRLYEWGFRQCARQVAAAMGVKLDDLRLVKKGTCAGAS